MSYKKIFVPKEYYPALMYANKLGKERGLWEKGITIAANAYNVNEKVLREYVYSWRHTGKRTSSKQKWYRIVFFKEDYYIDECMENRTSWEVNENNFLDHCSQEICRATSLNNAEKNFNSKNGYHYERSGHLGTFINGTKYLAFLFKEFETKEEARQFVFTNEEILSNRIFK